jgi:hypothetical protein
MKNRKTIFFLFSIPNAIFMNFTENVGSEVFLDIIAEPENKAFTTSFLRGLEYFFNYKTGFSSLLILKVFN